MSLSKLDSMVQRGRDGKNLGLDMSAGRVNRYLNRFQRSRYLLIGGDSGVGKTTYTDAMVFAMLTYAIENKVKIHIKYFSFELSKEDKIMSWICMVLAKFYNFECTPDYLFGRIPGKPVTEDHYQLYLLARNFLEQRYLPLIDLIDYPLTPTGIFNLVLEHYEEIGTVQRAPGGKDKDGKEVRGRLIGFESGEEWEDGFIVGVIDHVALGVPERGQDLKRMIDSISRKVVVSRNMLGMSWVLVQQFNTEMNSSHRNMTGKGKLENMIAPNRLDFGDSKYTYRDADYVLGLISPNQFGLNTFSGYDVKKLGSNLIVPYLMKNRYGPDNRVLPTFINPLARTIRDMPMVEHEPAMNAIYEAAKNLQDRCLLYFPQSDDQL